MAKDMCIDWCAETRGKGNDNKYISAIGEKIQAALEQHERDKTARQAIEAANKSADAAERSAKAAGELATATRLATLAAIGSFICMVITLISALNNLI